MSTDERSLRDKIKDAERATAEIKRHLEHLTEEGLARHSTDNRGRPGVAAT
jgi:predicted ArsR family transcriptional regulator